MPYLTPQTTPSGTLCFSILIPDDQRAIAAFYGALIDLADERNWTRNEDTDLHPQEISALMLTAFDSLTDCEPSESTMPIASMIPFAGSNAPEGYLLCDGSAVSRSTYADLFTVIGTTYGVGDGSTTFNLPDMRGRTVVGAGQGSGLTNRALGASFGEESHELTLAELPSHNHPRNTGGFTESPIRTGSGNSYQSGGSGTLFTSSTTGNTGSNTAHNNMQPSLATNYIIKF